MIYNSVRVAFTHWYKDEDFEKFMSVMADYRDVVDQITFFSSYYHPAMPLETAAEHCAILKKRIARAKELGFSSGINILGVLGHHPECMDRALKSKWSLMTNIKGESCPASNCMNDDRYLEEYVTPLYKLHLEAKPDFLWSDDDVRAGHYPIGKGCFCDKCMEDFNIRYGYSYSRETLKADFDKKEKLDVRKNWLDFQSGKITKLYKHIRNVVNSVDDSVTLGFMYGSCFFEGQDVLDWVDALSDGGKYEIICRPGGGAYTDDQFEDFMIKLFELGMASSGLPDYVVSKQSEIENWPYQIIKKGPRMTALEALIYNAGGCTGAAFNILPNNYFGEDPESIRLYFDEARKVTPLMKKMTDTMGNSQVLGIHTAWHRHSCATAAEGFCEMAGAQYIYKNCELFSFGLPEAYDFNTASCYFMSENSPYAFSHDEIMKILSKGAFLDHGAVKALCDMGYGEYVGFDAGEIFDEDLAEIYASHPINEGFAGKKRVSAAVFGPGKNACLIPHKGAEVLCYLTKGSTFSPLEYDTPENTFAECSMGIFRNKLGGIVCASGYYTLKNISFTVKTIQLKRIFRMLSGDSLGALAESYGRVRVIPRRTEKGMAVSVLNMNLDTIRDFSILVEGDFKSAVMTKENMEDITLVPCGKDGNMTRFTLPEIDPYSLVFITAE